MSKGNEAKAALRQPEPEQREGHKEVRRTQDTSKVKLMPLMTSK